MSDTDETQPATPKFDFSAFPVDTLFYDRRSGLERREAEKRAEALAPRADAPHPHRRAKKERRRRVDPTTFEKQYSDDEMEFMKAMQDYKNRTGKSFPSYGDVLRVAAGLGYRKSYPIDDEGEGEGEPTALLESTYPA